MKGHKNLKFHVQIQIKKKDQKIIKLIKNSTDAVC